MLLTAGSMESTVIEARVGEWMLDEVILRATVLTIIMELGTPLLRYHLGYDE